MECGQCTDLSYTFDGRKVFNSDVSRWNVANATDLRDMFSEFKVFNSVVSRWDVANATNLSGMFRDCGLFNSNVSTWNVANATHLGGMFYGCDSFNRKFVSRWLGPIDSSGRNKFGQIASIAWAYLAFDNWTSLALSLCRPTRLARRA
jgi:surface protein